ncbi:type II toxin-antitoxin system HicB family antitoxin [Deferribacter autotrophicus]|uniref:Type II toxin-antitoxin system HicB family antitoxin n=1 Tax=Deferribacter autotrophicus TaxID=500465 RepID=A0A5A8F714_9BACT|nr:type II toxin-antitoxin system HicB family antitoxin [Deferribacter autotrophicus]KAA0257616.1 type II toxin-antitoxin system HicB family antitoxin [Deferribacter autotrophicus]
MSTYDKKVEYYMSLPYTYEIIKEEDGSYFIKVKELKGCMSVGDTVEEAYEMIRDAMKDWFYAALESEVEIPLPETITKEKEFSGKVLLRMPKTLHKTLALNAKKEGVSLNAYLVHLLSINTTLKQLDDKLEKIIKNKPGDYHIHVGLKQKEDFKPSLSWGDDILFNQYTKINEAMYVTKKN